MSPCGAGGGIAWSLTSRTTPSPSAYQDSTLLPKLQRCAGKAHSPPLGWSRNGRENGEAHTPLCTPQSSPHPHPSNGLDQRSSTGGPRPPGGPWRYCRGSAKLFHLKHFFPLPKIKNVPQIGRA